MLTLRRTTLTSVLLSVVISDCESRFLRSRDLQIAFCKSSNACDDPVLLHEKKSDDARHKNQTANEKGVDISSQKLVTSRSGINCNDCTLAHTLQM